MDLQELRKKIKIMSLEDSSLIRSKYIKTFVDTDSEYFKKNILTFTEFSDGYCYQGYLWDCLKKTTVLSFNDVAGKKNNEVMVLWDIHSKDRILINNYWNFGKQNVVLMEFNLLIENLDFFPQDIYIFDKSFTWTIILTHEYVNGNRWCLFSA